MTQIVNVDGMGQLGTRVWPSPASLPAVRAGALVVSDDGTNATLYFGGDLSGTLTWIPLVSTLSGAILKVPPSSFYNVIASPVGGVGLGITGAVLAGLAVSGNGTAITIEKETAPTSAPLLQAQGAIDTSTEDWDVLQTVIPSSPEVIIRNVSMRGVLATRVYPSLSALPAAYLGAIAVVDDGATGTAYFGADVAGVATWTSLRGATGSTGPTGATPIFNSPSITTLSPGSGATLVQSGDGSLSTPYHQTFGIPAGSPGAQGMMTFPDLPAPGAPAATFQMIIEAAATVLPFIFPAGYTVHVISVLGFWRLNDALGNFITSANGSDDNASNGKALGGLVWQEWTVDSHGIETALGTLENYTTDIIISDSGDYVVASMNVNVGDPTGGYLLATIEITPSPATGTRTFDFTVNDQGWESALRGSTPQAQYNVSTNWSNVSGLHECIIARQITQSSTILSGSFTAQCNGADGAMLAFVNTTRDVDSGTNHGTLFPGTTVGNGTHTEMFTGVPLSVVAGDWLILYSAGDSNTVGTETITSAIFGWSVIDPFS